MLSHTHSITTANPSIESCVYTGITLEMSVGFPVLAGVLAVLVLENLFRLVMSSICWPR